MLLIFAGVIAGGVYLWFYLAPPVTQQGSVENVMQSKSTQVFEPVLPNIPVKIPQDFHFHDEYQHEWWHFFANVEDINGKRYGIQWSYFRVAMDDREGMGWQNPQLYVSHVVVSDKDKVWKEQRLARGGIGQAGMANRPFRLWIDNWSWRSLGQTPFPGQLSAASDSFNVQLKAVAHGPYVLPGDKGYVEKHDLLPIASYNLTSPFIKVKGALQLDSGLLVPVEGSAWMSKEWGSGLIVEGQKGWDWFVFHLDDETTLSISRYRHAQQLPYLFGTLSRNDGKVINLSAEDITIEPHESTLFGNGKRIPLQWDIHIPRYNINLTTQVLNQQLWLPFVVPYWEGPIQTTGTHKAKGFMQLTGY
ncbi:carotenoid 1,2-hydratase [Vibrio coralliilyticus]|nr:carotenoid 1,2-hydratase [Vibrio sp. SCSIO 43186]USD47129.1 carotenoid 1,2-hydratase [Vibrio sp. SCSIO 43145]USD71183.1 carotenoid 1,2-hydratase [Vibrio sp. SCSIO 43139]USD97468.1 carotenoid 1,2-hydratase [Vibrio coralliilyticus]